MATFHTRPCSARLAAGKSAGTPDGTQEVSNLSQARRATDCHSIHRLSFRPSNDAARSRTLALGAEAVQPCTADCRTTVTKRLRLGVLGPKSVLGEYEVLYGSEQYLMSAYTAAPVRSTACRPPARCRQTCDLPFRFSAHCEGHCRPLSTLVGMPCPSDHVRTAVAGVHLRRVGSAGCK